MKQMKEWDDYLLQRKQKDTEKENQTQHSHSHNKTSIIDINTIIMELYWETGKVGKGGEGWMHACAGCRVGKRQQIFIFYSGKLLGNA